jgi:hypothetical protein
LVLILGIWLSFSGLDAAVGLSPPVIRASVNC